ncbi:MULTISPECIES: hypothetical protein [Rhodomicrobium]|uniref:hypothetical protein n=1 Tax=Rhodomicrobium TaxID=1068 RepID=UPI000B4B3E87|nr:MULTISPECIES: hypothetical protein [Rhodomicrobium]
MMPVKIFEYPALLARQGGDAPPLVLLSASAVEIDQWVGIPQKSRLLDGETIGFQRDVNELRVQQIARFYSEPRNVIHNPLLCAIRKAEGVDVAFTPTHAETDASAVAGTLKISLQDRSTQRLVDLFRQAREALEERVPELTGRADPDELIAKLRSSADVPISPTSDDNGEEPEDYDGETDGEVDATAAPEEALFEESHVTEFWAELRAREVLLTRLGDQFQGDEFVGFGREALEAYLRPVVLVDGQHRLMGALRAARDSIDNDPKLLAQAASKLVSGTAADQVEQELLIERARRLPISLLLEAAPGEHVFQFVVVNQKATPVRPALLATIISTSLSEGELAPITDRLESAGIPLKSSRAISFFARNPQSPFANLVTRGLADEGSDLLPWTVLGQLVTLFRELRGARYFHDRKIDYADVWRRRFLESSKIAFDSSTTDTDAFNFWQNPDGPWRAVFIEFWSAVRDALGNTSNPNAYNYWGRPRASNLFNKPTLTTLATDFFAFLVETRKTIDTADQVPGLVDEWLLDLDRNYFARDWRLSGVKKDAPGTRKQWSKVWYGYRRDPRMLPNVRLFSTLYKEG